MSALRSVNWALAWRRSIWTIVWAAMMALLVVMCLDLAAHQPVIFGIVMLAAFVGSIGLAYTRISWQNGAQATAAAALLVSLLAIFTHAFMEASYWSSVIDQINQEVNAERAVSDARAAVASKRKERYLSSSNGKSVGQIEAEIKAAEQNKLFRTSEACNAATTKDSSSFCESYWLLKSKLAAAKEAGQLEGIVWSAGTTVETTAKRNLAAIALLAANLFGGNAEQYTAVIVITLVLFTQALLAFALVIGWAPEKPREATAQAEAPATTTMAPIAVVAPPAPSPRSEMTIRTDVLEKIAGVKASSAPSEPAEISTPTPEVTPDPDGDGTPAEKPIAPEEAPEDTRKVVSLFRDDGTLPEAPRSTKKATKPEAKAEAWLAAVTTQTDNPRHQVTSGDCWKSYLAYCDAENKRPMHRKAFSSRVGVLVGRKTGKGKKRDKNGAVFTGLLLNPTLTMKTIKTARRAA